MRKLKTALLISGGGTTAEAVIKAIQKKKLTGIEPVIIASTPEAKGIERIKKLGMSVYVIDRDTFDDIEMFGQKLLQFLKLHNVQLISLQGWLPMITSPIINEYRGMIINQHPGPLDPGRTDFGGKGMSNPYRITCARIAYTWMSLDAPWTESDVHLVEEEFDKGNLIRIEKMPIPAKSKRISIEKLRKDSTELISMTHETVKKLYPVEYKNVIASLQMFVDEIVEPFTRKKPLIAKENGKYVAAAKKLAIELFPYKNL